MLTKLCTKLFAVVSHKGSDISSGHYITDIYQGDIGAWVRCDDAQIKAIPNTAWISNTSPLLTPYLLFYQRSDTMQQSNASKSSKLKAGMLTGFYFAC